MTESIEQLRALAHGAKELLEHPSFKEAFSRMRRRRIEQLVIDGVKRRRRDELIAEIRVMDAIALELNSMVNDLNMAVRKHA
jgi:crotonobetainyl-CoA:carnitine CoA-transferase CaiB-like acyl-CoA transferase